MSTHIFRADPGVTITVEIESGVDKLTALAVAQHVLFLHQKHLSIPIDTVGEEVPREQEEQDQV